MKNSKKPMTAKQQSEILSRIKAEKDQLTLLKKYLTKHPETDVIQWLDSNLARKEQVRIKVKKMRLLARREEIAAQAKQWNAENKQFHTNYGETK